MTDSGDYSCCRCPGQIGTREPTPTQNHANILHTTTFTLHLRLCVIIRQWVALSHKNHLVPLYNPTCRFVRLHPPLRTCVILHLRTENNAQTRSTLSLFCAANNQTKKYDHKHNLITVHLDLVQLFLILIVNVGIKEGDEHMFNSTRA